MKSTKELVRERISQAMEWYKRYKVFTIALTYKELSGEPVCLVYPKSHSMPGKWNPCAFNYGILFRKGWKDNPENVLDWIEKHWL